ncbi:MAG: HAMP domain-containing histidine kinase [Lachnospiraceae bacterium]|nr:HAMP domain-containing histidine kinase [Lachnospiraceae bacterium]
MVVWFLLHLLACLVLFPMIAMSYERELFTVGVGMFSILCGVEAVLIIREGVQRNKVLDGISKIADGDLEYKIAEEELKGDNRKLAHAVNDIGEGLHRAVDDSMKNERLQADLITNVSHDIKTPLTSIINYVDLLKREELENERARNYIKVLDTKSQRLKQLAEDLVEASRISSGNIKLDMERINLVELVHQTEGEFAERFEERGLNIISNLPRESVVILADGRRIWRVLENLYNNVAKYAMENTRVYVDMYADGNQVLFSIKNISENPLNIEADELTERFIRGDISRSTEGSGLGLSIAKNLMIMMGGTFQIYLDGDLFKVMIGFKQEPEQREKQDYV